MSYSDSLGKISKARIDRDQVREKLYALQMKYQLLKKLQQKAVTKDISANDKTSSLISNLRKSISDLIKQFGELSSEISKLTSLSDRLKELNELLTQLQLEIHQIQNKISGIENELANGDISKDKKAALEKEKKTLQYQQERLDEKVRSLRTEIKQLQGEIADHPSNNDLKGQQEEVKNRIADLENQLKTAIQQNTTFTSDKGGEMDETKKQINEQRNSVKAKDRVVGAAIGELFGDQKPQQLIENWDDQTPVFLQPIRLETKFITNGNTKELCVRIFPDDIAVVTHEKALTKTEVDLGMAHWKELWKAGQDSSLKKAAWKILADKFGNNRAAWVSLSTKPINWNNALTLSSENELQFPVIDVIKLNSWTQAPHTRVMPDKFVIMGYRGGVLKYSEVGKQVNDILVLGPSPVEDGDNPSINRNPTDNRLDYGEDFNWVVDFDKALDIGMAFKIPLENESATAGFDQLLVVGLKLSTNEKDGGALLGDLFRNHRYSIKGLNLVQQGTPTNNTEEEDAGFSVVQSIDDIANMIESNQTLFTPVADWREAKDGQRLADYFGLDYSVFQSVQNSHISDHTEAIAMNRALYAATMGYYMHSMLNEVINDEGLQKLRSHFTNYVTGRGPLASIRVGNQPYGILVTSAFDLWKYPGRPGDDRFHSFTFYRQLHDILKFLQTSWQKSVAGLAQISKKANPSDNLMQILGLHPNSVEFFQRVGYSFDYLKNLEGFGWGEKNFSDVFMTLMENLYARQILEQFGYTQTNGDGTVKPSPLLFQLIFQHYHTRLDNKNLIDGQPLSEKDRIKPYGDQSTQNYIEWLIANAADVAKLEKQDFGGSARPNSMLFLMMLNSLLLESSESIYKYLNKNNILPNELIRSRKFMNISSSVSVTPWEIFRAPVNKLVNTETSTLPVYEFIHSQSTVLLHPDLADNLAEHIWSLDVLKSIPTARLERTLVEHVDTLSYRLDSWQTSLFEQRLQQQRNIGDSNDQRKTGIYLASYGYLENIKPADKRNKISEQVLPLSLRENKDNLFVESNNGGYIHTPSLNHATAAAILRNGYLSHASATDKDLLSVNLSSERVRRAKFLIDGIRNGQTLEVLLGYQFERGFHEWSTRRVNPVILNQLVPYFRLSFPVTKTKIPQEQKTTGPEEVIKDFHVVNGLTLANISSDFPYGITNLPTLSTAQVNAIKIEKQKLEASLDALRDLLSSESAYQLALGNFDRAAAVMKSISESNIPPEIEVINSSRGTDLSFTNKVVIHFDSTLTTNPWPSVPLTQKALSEPGLNSWIGTLLGNPSDVRCAVRAVDKDGNILKKPDNSPIEGNISLEDLLIQPIDFIYLIRNRLEETGTSELEARVRFVFAERNSLPDDTIVKITFAESGDETNLSIKSFAEILPLANYIHAAISGSRPMAAKDFEPASKTVNAPVDNPNNINWNELLNRIQNVFNQFNNLLAQITSAVSDAVALKTESAVNILRTKLRALADSGYTFSFPQSSTGFGQAEIDILTGQANSVIKRFAAFREEYNSSLLIVNDVQTKIDRKVSLLIDLVKGMLGDDFAIMPHFVFNNTTEIAEADLSRNDLLNHSTIVLNKPYPVNEWLHGVAQVRMKMHRLEMIRLLNDMFSAAPLVASPMQLPYKDKDVWLAVEFPEGTTIDHDTLSIIQYMPQGFDITKEQCGLIIDSWTEVIPNKEEVTGISFNYNQPNSVPPQALLLAVTPNETGSWNWDELVAILLDTFDRAKRRAVEPDHIDAMSGIGSLLPAVLAEFSTSKTNISLDYSFNISTVFEKANAIINEI